VSADGFGFAWPWALALLAVLPVALAAGGRGPEAAPALRLPFRPPAGAGAAVRSRPGVAGLVVCALLALAAARPQWIVGGELRPASGRDLLLVLDVSASMGTRDLRDGARALTRLDAATRLAARFLAARPGDRAGLVVFGDRPYLYVPPSYDLAAVGRALEALAPGVAGERTALGDALAFAVRTLSGGDTEGGNGGDSVARRPAASAAVVLVTDGAHNAGALTSAQAAWLAARAGVRVHALAVGAAADAAGLAEIAAQTGGVAAPATDAAAMAAFFERVGALEPAVAPGTDLGAGARELYPLPLAAALLVLAASVLGRPRWRAA
jgi:Ca-activated chloride channel family protein